MRKKKRALVRNLYRDSRAVEVITFSLAGRMFWALRQQKRSGGMLFLGARFTVAFLFSCDSATFNVRGGWSPLGLFAFVLPPYIVLLWLLRTRFP